MVYMQVKTRNSRWSNLQVHYFHPPHWLCQVACIEGVGCIVRGMGWAKQSTPMVVREGQLFKVKVNPPLNFDPVF